MMKFLVCFLLGLATANAQGYAYSTHHPLGYAAPLAYKTYGLAAYSPVYKSYTGYSPAYYHAAPVAGFKYAFSTPHDGVVAYNTIAAAPVVAPAPTVVKTLAAPAATVTHVETAAPAAVVKSVAVEAPVAQVYAPAYAKAQYHEQNQLGEYKFGYVGDTSAREEVRNANGVVTGHYTYLDSNNIPQKVNYVADAAGFRVAATNLPVDANHPVAVAPVAAAPATVTYAAAAPAVAVTGDAINPHVPYTPEVAHARARHFQAVNEALVATAVRAKRSADPAGYYTGRYSGGRYSGGYSGRSYSRGSYARAGYAKRGYNSYARKF